MEELTKLDFAKYPAVENGVNDFMKKFYGFRTVYLAMVNAFENSDIVHILNENLKLFFEKFEKFILTAPKMENENSLKQYKLFIYI